MRTIAAAIIGALIMWIIMAIWAGTSAWVFTRIPPSTHPDCRTRIRVWHRSVEQEGASWPE